MCARDAGLAGAEDAGTGGASRTRQPIEEYLELHAGIIQARRLCCVDEGGKRNTGVAIGHQENIVCRIERCFVGAKISAVYSDFSSQTAINSCLRAGINCGAFRKMAPPLAHLNTLCLPGFVSRAASVTHRRP